MDLMRTGDSGSNVGDLHQDLIESGLRVAEDELASHRFGVSTYNAVRQFQATHVDRCGHALAEDGVVGPETYWALLHPGAIRGSYVAQGWRCEPSRARPELVPVLQWAVGQIGQHETPDGSNRGPAIDQWTGKVGHPVAEPGPPWCAFFVSAAFRQLQHGSPFGILASALRFKEWAECLGRLVRGLPEPGDIWVILRADYHGHVGMVGGVNDDGRVSTIEGNAANAVRGLVREVGTFAAIVRPA